MAILMTAAFFLPTWIHLALCSLQLVSIIISERGISVKLRDFFCIGALRNNSCSAERYRYVTPQSGITSTLNLVVHIVEPRVNTIEAIFYCSDLV